MILNNIGNRSKNYDYYRVFLVRSIDLDEKIRSKK